MNSWILALVFGAGLAALHLQQVDRLSGSVGEYWKRTDANARTSKLLFGLSLCSCVLIPYSFAIGLACALAFIGLSLGFSMNEWKS